MVCDDICYMIYITAVGLTTGGSSTVHIYTQKTHRTTQSTQTIHRTTQLANWEEYRPCPVFASYTLAFALQQRKKSGKTVSQGSRRMQLGTRNDEFSGEMAACNIICSDTRVSGVSAALASGVGNCRAGDQGRSKVVTVSAATWVPTFIGAPKRLLLFHILCQTKFQVDAYIAVSTLSVQDCACVGFPDLFLRLPQQYLKGAPVVVLVM